MKRVAKATSRGPVKAVLPTPLPSPLPRIIRKRTPLPRGSTTPMTRSAGTMSTVSAVVRRVTVPTPSTNSIVPVSSPSAMPSVAPQLLAVTPVVDPVIEHKRIQIGKQLVVLLHAIVCSRRDLNNNNRGAGGNDDEEDEGVDVGQNQTPHTCSVPYCGLMKGVLQHVNTCQAPVRTCGTTHCSSSKQILTHWKHCVKSDCPVCISLRAVIPSSLLRVFPNPLCRAELLQRQARAQEQQNLADGARDQPDQIVPELMEVEE